jgi:RND family efflux transporter MFP subunit
MQLVALFLLALATLSCTRGKTKPAAARSVKVDTVRVQQAARAESFPGKVKASAEARVAFMVAGKIAVVHVAAGDAVKRGQTLAVLDDRDYRLQLAAAEAAYQGVKAEAGRVISLHASGSVTPNDRDKAAYGLQAMAAKRAASANALADTRLVAPFDGHVQQRFHDAGETVGAGTPVFSLIAAGSPRVEVAIPPSTLARRDDFEEFSFSDSAFPGKKFTLELVGITREANLNGLHVAHLNTREGEKPFPAPGSVVLVEIRYKSGGERRLTVPYPSIFERDGDSRVWIYDPATRTVSSRAVEIEQVEPDGSVTITGGAREGEIVVSAGAGYLREGETVRLSNGGRR